MKKKEYPNLYQRLKDINLSETELKGWLADPVTTKFILILKALRKEKVDQLINFPDKTDLNIGFCQGYDSIIYFLERTIASREFEGDLPEEELLKITKANIEELLDLYMSNLNK